MQSGNSSVVPNPGARPVFVVGNPRSGTTMFRLMLTSHPNLVLPHESKFLIAFFEDYARLDGFDEERIEDFCDQLWAFPKFAEWKLDRSCLMRRLRGLEKRTYANVVDAIYREYAETQGKPNARWGDKNPYYILSLPEIMELFPQAQIIHLLRDGRASAASMIRTQLGTIDLVDGTRIYQNDAVGAAQMYRKLLPQGRREGLRLGPVRYTEIRYEDLVTDPEKTLRRVCEFLGEPFAPEMLTYHKMNRERELVPKKRIERFHRLTLKPPVGARATAWKSELSRCDLLVYEYLVADVLTDFDYRPHVTHMTLWDHVMVRWVLLTRPIIRTARPLLSRIKHSVLGSYRRLAGGGTRRDSSDRHHETPETTAPRAKEPI